MRYLLLFVFLSQLASAKPFGTGTAFPDYSMDPSWMQGAGIVSGLDSAAMNADAVADVIGFSHAEDRVFWLDMSSSTPAWNLVADDVCGPAALCVIDVDYDNDMDLVISSRWDRRLLLFLNQGDGSFLAGADIASGIDTAVALRAADLDGDGLADLVGISDFDRQVFWLKHNANGSFSSKQVIASTVGAPTQLELVDFRNDGTLDIAVLDSSPGSVIVLNNEGTALFEQSAHLGVGVTSFSATVFDGSRPDIITLSSTLGTCIGHRNDNAEGFESAVVLASGINGRQIVGHGDLDQDGDYDLLLNAYASGQILWMQNRGGLVFDLPDTAASSPLGSTHALLVDTDADSDPELIQATLLGSELVYYEGFGSNPYDSWLDGYSLTSDANPLGGDANANGMNNLTAYAYNLSPIATEAWPRLVLETGTSGLPIGVFHQVASDLGIEFVQHRGSASGLTYSVMSSGDLVTWTPVDPGLATITVIDSDWERVRYSLPSSSDQKGFLQLQVAYSE